SSASLCALLAARERATGFRTNDAGVDRVLTAYTSTQAHSSLEKAAGVAGVGRRNVRLIDVDAAQAMRPDALERAIAEDRRAGRIGRGVRLPGLARPAGPPLPGAQAVVRDPALRRRGAARAHPAARRPRPGIRRLGGGRRPLRAGGAGAAQPRLLPSRRRRR